MPRKVAVLGSTGSIGTRALDIIRRSPSLELHALYCRSSLKTLREQNERYRPTLTGIAVLPPGEAPFPGLRVGEEHLEELIRGADVVLNAVVGSAGLRASLSAQERGLLLALANKESLVAGGELLRPHLERGRIIPVDSEHSTVFRCLLGEERPPRRIVLTASGGALRDLPPEEAAAAPVDRVLRHPTWPMGARITVDSSTLVNKAFEVIESRWLFPGIPVDVVVHPESVVHSFVETADGAWEALLGLPDMAVPISYALHWPDLSLPEHASRETPCDWGPLTFRPLEETRYPAYTAVLSAYDMGGTAPAAANAADERAVSAFLEKRIPVGAIPVVIQRVLDRHENAPADSLEAVLNADRAARLLADRVMESL